MSPLMRNFYNLHAGETCLIIGNGNSLNDIPVDFLRSYTNIGSNTIIELEGFTPTYYAAVDKRIMREWGEVINERYRDIPKFIPAPNLDKWQGENFYRWYHRPGDIELNAIDFFAGKGITYYSVMDIQIQLANLMGFTRILIVGMDHGYVRHHFWGSDEGAPNIGSDEFWSNCDTNHGKLYESLREKGTEVLNISTFTSCDVFPKGNWKDYKT